MVSLKLNPKKYVLFCEEVINTEHTASESFPWPKLEVTQHRSATWTLTDVWSFKKQLL